MNKTSIILEIAKPENQMKLFFITVFTLFTGIVSAQEFTITGTVKDTANVPLEAATVYLETVADSTLVTYVITDRDGTFQLEGSSSKKKMNLYISYTGYGTIKKQLTLTKSEFDLGEIVMKLATNSLGEIMITANRAPIVLKSDTLQFNASSFNTRPDANLEALLKKLPGVAVDSEGSITVNGVSVSKILLNGEEFFGNDPKIATKNIPKEIIDKIQVMSTKTKAEEFTGKAGDPDDKTINITTKEGMNKGFFTRLSVGGGTDDRYALNGIANYFKDDLRIRVLGSSNSINNPGFSFDEVYGVMEADGRGGGGITKSDAFGVDIGNEWNETIELGGNYFYGGTDTESRSTTRRENILPDGRFFTNSSSSSNGKNDSHRASLGFEIEPDTLTRISFRPKLDINNGVSTRNSTSESIDQQGDLVNTSKTSSHSENYSASFGSRLNFIRKFGSNGAYLGFNFSNGNDVSDAQNLFTSERTIFDADTSRETTETQKQLIDEDRKENEYNFGIEQRSVLTKNFFLDLSYQFETTNGENSRKVYDFNATTGDYSDLDQTLSNTFEYSSLKHIPNVGLSYEGEKWRASFNAGLLSTQLKSENSISNTSFDDTFNNLYLNARVRYNFTKSANIDLSYRNDTDIPSLQQLQPVTDRTNPLHIVTGNPELSPAFTQRLSFRLRNYDYSTRSGYYAYLSANFTDDKVVTYTVTGEDLIRETTYTNVDGAYSIRFGGSFMKRFKEDKRTFRYSIGAHNSYDNSVGFSNGEKYVSARYRIGPHIDLDYEIQDLFSISPSYRLSYYISQYDIFKNREENYADHRLGMEITSYWPKNVVFGNNISYNYYGNVSDDFDSSSLLWNASLGYKFLDDDATVSLRVYDLLNQNISTRRTTGDDYIQDTQSLILEQYFMLSFTYKLNKFGGKDISGGRRYRRH